jgi:phosphoribosyl-AMP cyclohydrolase
MPFQTPPSEQSVLERGADFTPKFGANGLVAAIVQDATTNAVLMFAWMNAAALEATIETGEATFFSRSRNELWKKGETSGNVMKIAEIRVDCDQDAVLLRVDPIGQKIACHTGAVSCFYRKVTTGSEGYALVRV